MLLRNSIDIYLSKDCHLIPLDMEADGDIEAAGKKPLHRNYHQRKYPKVKLLEYIEDEHNIGWVLGPQDIVIDVDPRNDGETCYKALIDEWGIADLSEIAPTVMSGRGDGGRHYYFKLPEGVTGKDLRKHHSDFGKGIEFIHDGILVVIPGSYHVAGEGYYDWDELSPFAKETPELPSWLVNRLKKTKPKNKKKESSDQSEASLTNKELKLMLDQLDVEDYRSHDDWLNIMFASHYATGGEGVNVFIRWSTSDPHYAGDEDIIRDRWDSISNEGDSLVTTATLAKEVLLVGGTLPGSVTAKEQFKEEIESDYSKDPLFTDIIEQIKKESIKKKPEKLTLRKKIDALDKTSHSSEVAAIMKELVPLNEIAQERGITDIAANTKMSKRILRKQFLQIKAVKQRELESDMIDHHEEIAKDMYRDCFNDGNHLLYSADEHYWLYNGRYWERYSSGMLEKETYKACKRYRADTATEFPLANYMLPTQRILKALVATPESLINVREVKPIINVKNGELWIDTDTGGFSLEEHDPSSRLLTCLDQVCFDKKQKCPLFIEALQEIFEPLDDASHVIRHLFEFYGYVIQPHKNIATWWLLHGRGSNGKTVILNVLQALLGDAALNRSIADFGAHGDKHAFASLPGKLAIIDDDLKLKTILPDDFLKKVSENKKLYANPKHAMGEGFISHACVVMASNELPRMLDLSDGLRRRAMLFPFKRKFSKAEQNKNLSKEIIETELSGVLNESLRGLRRLRKRGDFMIPRSCKKMQNEWERTANPLLDFVSETLNQSEGERLTLREVYVSYEEWCIENEIQGQYIPNIRTFSKSMKEQGFEVVRGTGGTKMIQDVTWITDEYKALLDMGL